MTPEALDDLMIENDVAGFVRREVLCTIDAQSTEIARLRERVKVLDAALNELHATVKGECPSLLDIDRGGSLVLFELLNAALQEPKP